MTEPKLTDHGWQTGLDHLPTVSFTVNSQWDTGEIEVPPDIPATLMMPRRRWLRWKIVEYLRMDGRVTREIHGRRFWLYRSARRYMHSFGSRR